MRNILLICVSILSFSIVSADLKKAFQEKINRPTPCWAKNQLKEDFAGITPADLTMEKFQSAINDKTIRKPEKLFLILYQIKNGHLHILAQSHEAAHESYGPDRVRQCTTFLNRLTQICEKNQLPDCEFLMGLTDFFCSTNYPKAPAFCFSKKDKCQGFLFPDTDCSLQAYGLENQAKHANASFPWHAKENRAFWRGASTGGFPTRDNYLTLPRYQLAEISHQFPQWVDAKFNILCQGAEHFRDKVQHYMGHAVPIHDHIRFKYQVLADGNSCAWSRAYWQLFSNCVIFKHKTSDVQWYYKGIKPGVHYVSVAEDFHDLVEKLQWAANNDKDAFKISQNAQKFANGNLKEEDLYYYAYLAINKYANVQKGK